MNGLEMILTELAGKRLGVKGFNPFSNLLPQTFYQPKAILIALGLLSCTSVAQQPQATLDAKHRAFFKDNCLNCHNAEKQKGKVRLDDIAFSVDSVEKADLWQKVLNSINSSEMPPEDEKQPDAATKTDFLDDLSRMLVTARAVLSDSGGKITMRRLNRREYKNTIRDLLGVDLRVNELPADGGAGTFDTVGSSLFMSSDQFEQYLALGRQALDEHFARFVAPPPARELKVHLEAENNKERIIKGLRERTDARERYLQWTAAVEAAAARPENAALVAKIRREKPNDANALHIQWASLKSAPSPANFGFTDAVHAEQMGRRDWNHFVPHHRAYVEHPLTKTGTFLTIDDAYVNNRQIFQLPSEWPAGDYVLRIRTGVAKAIPRERRFMEFGPQDPSGVCTVMSTHEITGTPDSPQTLEIPLKLSESKVRLFMLRERGSNDSDAAASRLFAEAKQRNGIGPEFALWIDWIEAVSVSSAVIQNNKLHVEVEDAANARVLRRADELQHGLDQYRKWLAAVDAAAAHSVNAVKAKEIRESQKVKAYPPAFYDRWAELKDAPATEKFGFKNNGVVHSPKLQFDRYHPYQVSYLELPKKDTGAYLTIKEANPDLSIKADANWPVGDYVLRVRIAALDDAPAERRFLDLATRGVRSGDFNILRNHQITGTMAEPQILETRITLTTSQSREFIIREKRSNIRELDDQIWQDHWLKHGVGPKPALWVDWMEIEGPVGASPIAAKSIKQRREVELHANAMVGGTYKGYFKGGYEEAKKFMETKQPQKGIPDEQEAKFRIRSFEQHGPSFERYLNDPLTKNGAYLTLYNVHKEEVITLPPDQPSGWLKTKHEVEKAEPGDYLLRFRIGAVKGTPKERHFVALGSRKAGDEDFTLMQTFQISGTTDAPQIIEVPVSLASDGPRTFVLREKRDVKLDHELYTAAQKATGVGPPSALWIDWVEWQGPLAPENTKTSVTPVLAAGETNARQVLETFAKRAFRGKTASTAFLDKLTALHATRLKAGDSFDEAIREPLSVILASPGFLYLQETGPQSFTPNLLPKEGAGKKLGVKNESQRSLSAPELASRLSYFLWSAPPDEQLLKADLTNPDVIAREVDRLIASPKADEFVSGFVHQWLGMDRLDFFQFDTKQFRDFDESAKAAARREVYETFAHLLRNNGSLTKLLKSDEIHVNGLLATYYGIEGISGDAFQKVKLPANSPRGGLLGMAAILAMGSNGERTSPVERGAWVLRKLLNNPPPPAPPNVPQLDRLAGKPISPRERLLAHQEEPQCLQCHRKIDPIGFGLENFNAAGKWRDVDHDPKTKKDWPIDPAGQFHNGPTFQTYYDLRDQIASQSENFAQGFTEALIEYALGRPYGFTDIALADDIVKKAKAKDFAMKEFFIALASSKEFYRK